MAPKLGPGEQVIFEGHPSWRSILDFYFKGLVGVVAVCLLAGFLTRILGDEVDAGLVSLLAVIGVALVILIGFIKRVTTSYTITNHRLHIKRGIVSRTIQETRLERVQNVNYHQGVLQRILQIGDVDFDTAAGDDYNFIFEGVAEPADVVHSVDQATRRSGTGLGHPEEEPAAPPPAPPPA
jgi:uncharacterized membrane protein YdbT with pleckstrin-like domain